MNHLGIVYKEQKKLKDAQSIIEKGLNTFETSNNLFGKASSLIKLGQVLLEMKELDKAESLIQESLKISERLDNRLRQARAWLYLGAVYEKRSDTSQAITYIDNALEVFEHLGFGLYLKKAEEISCRLKGEPQSNKSPELPQETSEEKQGKKVFSDISSQKQSETLKKNDLPRIRTDNQADWGKTFSSGLGKLSSAELKNIYQAVGTFKHNSSKHLFNDLESKLKKGDTVEAGWTYDTFVKEYQHVTNLINYSLKASFFFHTDMQVEEIVKAFKAEASPEELINIIIQLKRNLKKIMTRTFNSLEELQYNLNSLIESALEAEQDELEKRGVKYKLELESEENMVELFLDKGKITDALQCLTQNAADSFPLEQDEKLIIFKTNRNTGGNTLEVWVTDNGHGIEKERWETIFDQGNTTKGSDGLGLHLVKNTISKNGGSVCVEDSQQGHGTTFKIAFEV